MNAKRWKYYSESVGGNLHAAVNWVSTQHPDWDVVTMQYICGVDFTVVVWREELLPPSP